MEHYVLQDLLYRMGVAQDVRFGHSARWAYADPQSKGVGGFAEVRLDPSETILTVELRHWKDPVGVGEMTGRRVDTVFIEATRQEKNLFAISSMILDGEVYEAFDESLIDLVLSIFRSRAVEINMRMIEQRFKCRAASIDEILGELPPMEGQDNRRRPTADIIPFRPRADAPIQRM